MATLQKNFGRTGVALGSALFLGLIAFSWLVFPYYFHGEEVLFDTGEQVRGERYQNYSTLNGMLTRFIPFPGGIEVTTLYASEEYFAYADHSSTVEVYRPDTHVVFFVNEDVHTGFLPRGLPTAWLEIDGRRIEPVSAEGPEWVEHHRTSIFRFARLNEDGSPLLSGHADELVLKLSHPWDRYNYDQSGQAKAVESTWTWALPLNIPEELKSRDTFTSAMILSLSAGLLSSVLTPCLIQLVLVFFATMGGMTAEEVLSAKGITPEVKRRVFLGATLFVTGYVALFVISGAFIGYAGKEAQMFFANHTRTVGIVAGIVVILFGIWVGIRAQAPLVCKLPGATMIRNMQGRSLIGALLISIAFSLGCMACFGGAIIGTLFIYVGALGSASVGATIMGIFAAGVAIPFLLAAAMFSKMQNLLEVVGRHTRAIGAISAAVIVAFGLMLVTDNFHTVSDLIYPYLGLD